MRQRWPIRARRTGPLHTTIYFAEYSVVLLADRGLDQEISGWFWGASDAYNCSHSREDSSGTEWLWSLYGGNDMLLTPIDTKEFP